MGWLIACNATGKSPKQELAERLVDSAGKYRVVDAAMVGSIYYAAIENVADGYTFAVVCLTRGGYNRPFGYKDMDEGMGPCESQCPMRILDKLTPLDHPAWKGNTEYARAWRERCYNYHAARKAKGTPKPGQRVIFAEPIKFTNGMELADFIYDKGSRFRSADMGGLYRISGWKARNYTVASHLTA